MNISNLPIAVNQAPVQSAHLTQLSSGAAARQGSGSSGSDYSKCDLARTLDISGRQGYREDYSIRDAAEYLWKKETQSFNLKDLDDPEKAAKIWENMRQGARWDLGIDPLETREEAISNYIQGLRENGLDGSVDWSRLTRELKAFEETAPEELEDGLDYLASRYVAVQDKLERNFSGDELAAQKAKLEEIYQAGKSGMIDGYTKLLQDNLGISEDEAQAVRDSFSAILEEKVENYRGALEKVNGAVAQAGADSVWLKNHDAYIASQLRAEGTAGQGGAKYSVQDLAAAGKIAGSYRAEISGASSGGRNEGTLALNLAMADMKAETMIQKGLVSRNMAALLRSSRTQGHQNVMDALDRKLAEREKTRLSGEPKGSYAPVSKALFQGIYNAVMQSFARNGGNGAEAIRAGVSYGKTATAKAHAQNPKVFRYGNPMRSYWDDFYKTPDTTVTVLGKKINVMLAQSGQNSYLDMSTYQKYVSQWQDFVNAAGGGVDVRG